MRTVKASEVVKGMRVGTESTMHNVTVRIEGEVCEARTINNEQVALTFEDGTQRFYPGDHPVTVLAEPEPEWVEGAWYRVEINGNKTHARRVEGGWVRWDGVAYPTWEDIDRSRVVTVLGRVLIVDWPGDDVARKYLEWKDKDADSEYITVKAPALLAKAIRTQGGAR